MVKNFDFEYEKSRIISDIFARIKREAFSDDRRKSVVVKNGINIKNSGKVFDDNCTICMDTFKQGQGVLITPCKHCFHVECLQDWINSSVKKQLQI